MFNTEDVFYVSADVLLKRRGMRMSKGAMDAMLGRRPLESFRAFCDYLGLNEEPADLLAESRVIFHEMLGEHLKPMPGLFDLLQPDRVEGTSQGGRDVVATRLSGKYLRPL